MMMIDAELTPATMDRLKALQSQGCTDIRVTKILISGPHERWRGSLRLPNAHPDDPPLEFSRSYGEAAGVALAHAAEHARSI